MTISIGGTHAASFAATPALVRGTGGISLVLMAPLDYEENKEIRLKVKESCMSLNKGRDVINTMMSQ